MGRIPYYYWVFLAALGLFLPYLKPAGAAYEPQVNFLRRHLLEGVLYGNTAKGEGCTANVMLTGERQPRVHVTLFRNSALKTEASLGLPATEVFEFELGLDSRLYKVQRLEQHKGVVTAQATKRSLSGETTRLLEIRRAEDETLLSIRVADPQNSSWGLSCDFSR